MSGDDERAKRRFAAFQATAQALGLPEVRAEMFDTIRTWLELGVDGFRLDTVHHLFEAEDLRDNPPNPHFMDGMPPTQALDRVHQFDQPEVQDVLRDFRRLTDSFSTPGAERILVGEAYLPLDKIMAYYGAGTLYATPERQEPII